MLQRGVELHHLPLAPGGRSAGGYGEAAVGDVTWLLRRRGRGLAAAEAAPGGDWPRRVSAAAAAGARPWVAGLPARAAPRARGVREPRGEPRGHRSAGRRREPGPAAAVQPLLCCTSHL